VISVNTRYCEKSNKFIELLNLTEEKMALLGGKVFQMSTTRLEKMRIWQNSDV